jgi:nucleotidyltransferase substrate binding protein (TIGR01987 family)
MILDLTSLEKALAALDRALARSAKAPGDEELRDACIQRFEFTFELSWKMLKRRLEMDLPDAAEVDTMSYRTLIRAGAERGLIADPTTWFIYRDKRNLTTHTYDAAKANDIAGVLPRFAADARLLLDALRKRGSGDA